MLDSTLTHTILGMILTENSHSGLTIHWAISANICHFHFSDNYWFYMCRKRSYITLKGTRKRDGFYWLWLNLAKLLQWCDKHVERKQSKGECFKRFISRNVEVKWSMIYQESSMHIFHVSARHTFPSASPKERLLSPSQFFCWTKMLPKNLSLSLQIWRYCRRLCGIIVEWVDFWIPDNWNRKLLTRLSLWLILKFLRCLLAVVVAIVVSFCELLPSYLLWYEFVFNRSEFYSV